MQYGVFEDDNFHYMEEGECIKVGEYDTCEDALDVCKQRVDDYLLLSIEHFPLYTKTADDLYSYYQDFGPDSFILPGRFSAWNYAKDRCKGFFTEY